MSEPGTHNDLHSEQGALPGEHPGRAKNPIIKVEDLAWLEFEKPDLAQAERFAHAFGFATASRTVDELLLRGMHAGAPAVSIRKGPSRYAGAAFKAADDNDLVRLADATGTRVTNLPESIGGLTVDLKAPDGAGVRVVSGMHELPALDTQVDHVLNTGGEVRRTNSTQRPPRTPALVERRQSPAGWWALRGSSVPYSPPSMAA